MSARRLLFRLTRGAAALLLGMMLSMMLLAAPAAAQDTTATDPAAPDTTVADTTAVPPGGAPPGGERPSAIPQAEGAGEAVQFAARDSLVLTFEEEEGDVGTLFGEAEVTYGEANLTAYQVAILMDQDELHAEALPADTGLVGRPQFQRGGGESFSGRRLAYNIRTERGRVVEAQTAIQDGFIEGEVVKVTEDSTVYIQQGCYTTCPCSCVSGEASYGLRSTRMKQQDEWVYTGPLQLFIFNIPTPLWLPFGVLPSTESRRSGPLPPSYGEDPGLGLYLKNWGWYWAISDYMDLQLRFGVWSQGSWQVNPTYRYTKRYRYSGRLDVSYFFQQRGDPIDANYDAQRATSIRWTHSQEINPTSSLNGNVDLSTRTYLRQVSNDYEDNVRQSTNSSISYRKNWGPRSLNASLTHRQTFSTGEVSMTLPRMTFSQRSFQPFAREERGPGEDERWYERITTSYSGSLRNQYDFDPLTDEERRARGDTTDAGAVVDPGISWYEALVAPEQYQRATGDATPFDFSAEHSIPVSASFTVNRLPLTNIPLRLNLSPNLNYSEEWFVQTQRIERVIEDGDMSRVDRTVPGFFALRQFSAGISANTDFYGLFPVRLGPYQDLRHVVRLSSSFSYSPDYYGGFWGYTRTYLNQEDERERYAIVGGVPRGEQRTLSFNLGNEFQTRRVRTDSTGEEQSRTIKLLDLDLNTGYNFAADSLNLNNINLSARTNIANNKYNLTLRTTWSPYAYVDGRPVDRFVLEERWALARLTNLSFSANTSFEGGSGGGGALGTRQTAGSPPPYGAPGGFPGPQAPGAGPGNFGYPLAGAYADFSIPWSLDLRFNYRYSNTGRSPNYNATLNVGFNFNVTPRWKVSGDTGYDFVDWELARTQFNVLRDLGCWQMSFNWTPFGRYQQYGFSLYVKSGQLSNLLRLDLPRSGIKDRFTGAAAGAIGAGI